MSSTSRQWYKIICIDKERRQQRVEELRKEKQDQEMAECTFRPELMTKGSKKVILVVMFLFDKATLQIKENLYRMHPSDFKNCVYYSCIVLVELMSFLREVG